ncbi:hypothetical protein Tco_1530355 [Tanacetum coccineum]
MKIIPNEEEVAIDAIPLAVKSPSIVDWKIYKEGRKSYYQIMRADGKSQMYMFFSQMLKSFDRGDLEDLYKRCSLEESTSIQSVGLEAIRLMWSTFLDDATCAYLYVAREEYIVCTSSGILVLLMNFKKYKRSSCTDSLYKVKILAQRKVNAASENMLEVTTASEYQVNAAS